MTSELLDEIMESISTTIADSVTEYQFQDVMSNLKEDVEGVLKLYFSSVVEENEPPKTKKIAKKAKKTKKVTKKKAPKRKTLKVHNAAYPFDIAALDGLGKDFGVDWRTAQNFYINPRYLYKINEFSYDVGLKFEDEGLTDDFASALYDLVWFAMDKLGRDFKKEDYIPGKEFLNMFDPSLLAELTKLKIPIVYRKVVGRTGARQGFATIFVNEEIKNDTKVPVEQDTST